MRSSTLRRTLSTLGLVAITGSAAGCAGGMASLAAGLDQAAGTQYYNFSEAEDKQAYCDQGRTRVGYFRIYHGIANNHRYIYYYNATTVPIDVETRWSDATVASERVYPGNYSSRSDRWATITAMAGATIRCSLR